MRRNVQRSLFDNLLGFALCCLLLTAVAPPGAAEEEESWCMATGVSPGVAKSRVGHFNVRGIFVTFPEAVMASGDSLLPDFADEMARQFEDYLFDVSRGMHAVDFQVVKRPGADSTYAWVMSMTRGEYRVMDTLLSELQDMLPSGWDDDVDLPVYFFGAKPTCCGAMGLSHGRLSERNNYVYIRYGNVGPAGYIRQDPWLVKGILVHEYGHQLGAGHLPDATSGELGWCSGGYWSCYGAMDRGLFSGCDRWQEFDGFVPYNVFNMIRFGWIRPQVILESQDGIELGDVRETGDVLKIPIPDREREYFLVENHQMNNYDRILNGRGLLIWHVREIWQEVQCTSLSKTEAHIIDLEHQSGKWERDPSSSLAPLWPHIPDPVEGRDTLDYEPSVLPSAFFTGLTLGGSPLQGPDEFGPDTNPSSFAYAEGAANRRDPQDAPSGVEIRCIEAIPDPQSPGSYVMKFDVVVD